MSEVYDNRESIDSSAQANYYLDDAEFVRLQSALISSVRDQSDQEGIHSVWIAQNHPYANVVRTLEAKQFPEISEIMEPFEDQCVFLALTDTRPEQQQRVVHAFRLSSIFLAGRTELPEGNTLGIAFIDDMVASDQGVDIEAFKAYYTSRGIDLAKCISVETNFRIGDKVKVESGLRIPDLGYIAIFQAVEKLGLDKEDAVIFAHLNKPAIISLGVLGISYEPVMGNESLRTPTTGDNPFDDRYRPVAIPPSLKNIAIIRQLLPFAAPEVHFNDRPRPV